jgi:hypothetical protein
LNGRGMPMRRKANGGIGSLWHNKSVTQRFANGEIKLATQPPRRRYTAWAKLISLEIARFLAAMAVAAAFLFDAPLQRLARRLC